jgi:hypothetical protein
LKLTNGGGLADGGNAVVVEAIVSVGIFEAFEFET